jgi:trigger factor
VHFHVHVRALSAKELPPLDDEFAKDHGECSTLDELRQRARTRLESEAAQHADDAMRQALLDALASANDVPIPNALIERRTEALIEEVWREWQQRRIRPKNETEAVARLREELQPRARQQVKIGLLLEAIARQEDITVSEADVEERIAILATGAGAAAERLRAFYQDADARRELRNRMLQTRAVDAVVRVAHVTTRERAPSVAAVNENG